MTKYPMVSPRTQAPYLPPPGTAKAYDEQVKSRAERKKQQAQLAEQQARQQARWETAQKAAGARPQTVAGTSHSRRVSNLGGRSEGGVAKDNVSPASRDRGVLKPTGPVSPSDIEKRRARTAITGGSFTDTTGSIWRQNRANSVWTLTELAQVAPEMIQ